MPSRPITATSLSTSPTQPGATTRTTPRQPHASMSARSAEPVRGGRDFGQNKTESRRYELRAIVMAQLGAESGRARRIEAHGAPKMPNPVRGDANNVGTATTTADASDDARRRGRMAPNQCRAAPACNVPSQPDGPGGGRHRAALDRGRHRRRPRAGAALRSVQHGQPLSHPADPARQADPAVGRGGAAADRYRPRVLR